MEPSAPGKPATLHSTRGERTPSQRHRTSSCPAGYTSDRGSCHTNCCWKLYILIQVGYIHIAKLCKSTPKHIFVSKYLFENETIHTVNINILLVIKNKCNLNVTASAGGTAAEPLLMFIHSFIQSRVQRVYNNNNNNIIISIKSIIL